MDMMSYLSSSQAVSRHQQQSQHEPYAYFETNSCEPAWGAATGETFRIDDLLNFSNDDIGGPILDENTSVDSTEASASASASLDGNYSPENLPPATELCVPMDSLADLEWLSTFVEDSFSGGGLGELPLCNPAEFPSFDGKTRDDDSNEEAKKEQKAGNNEDARACSVRPLIPVRARSKRSRTGGRVWTSCPLVPNHHAFESYGSLFTSSDSSSNSSTVTSSWPLSRPPLAKKHKTSSGYSRKAQEALAQQQQQQQPPPRRCSHCLVQKTPQWRAGPLGPKTLCNACGVRFKSGRLLPEYRPAVSPTFLSDVHSNSHRKVLELRRQKEEEDKNIVFFHQHISQDRENPVKQEEQEDRREEQSFGILA
uniref:GATA transcription factor n=1 Tax=Wollemia nobilis TaxID=56998 RepID=A0A0C9S8E3_9CONI